MLVTSPYLQGAFAPVTEEITAFDLPVTGRIPAELSGRYLRNGPNPLGLEDPGYHWFIGAGMVHGVRLRDGRAEWYRNRWVRSRRTAEALGEAWPAGPVHADSDFAANTHIIRHAGRTLATVEAGALPYELSAELGTVGPCDFGGSLPGGFAAHTKLDPRTGELHAIAYFWAWDYVQHVVIGADGLVARTTNIPLPHKPMMHDFALTEKYVVLFDLPVTFSMDAAASGRPLPYTWNPDVQARVGLLPRDGSAAGVRWVRGRGVLGVPHLQRLRRRGRPRRRGPRQVPGRVRRLPARRQRPAHPRPVDHRPGRGRDDQPPARRQAAGIPAGGRAGDLTAAPLRLQRRHRRGQPGHDLAVR